MLWQTPTIIQATNLSREKIDSDNAEMSGGRPEMAFVDKKSHPRKRTLRGGEYVGISIYYI